MIFFFKTLNLNYVVHYITDSRVTDAISNKFQAVRADGNSDLSNEIGIELSKKSAAAGMRLPPCQSCVWIFYDLFIAAKSFILEGRHLGICDCRDVK